MAMKIAILEDNLDRQAAMRVCLADRFYMYDARFFDEAGDMIRFLEANLADTLLISLDNDLEMKPVGDGRFYDPGSGCQVAEFLASRESVCPVVIHTSNSQAAVTIEELLREASWKTRRVVPFEDIHWIETDWFFAVRRALVGPVRRSKVPSRL